MPQETNPRVRQTIAEVAVEGTKFTGEILPRYVYELAGAPVPPEATDELQKLPMNSSGAQALQPTPALVQSLNIGGAETGTPTSSSTTNLFHHYFPARVDAYLCIPGAG
ncbi:hypothetical protein ACVNSK_01450 [Corynebacterium propinquum]